MPEPILLSLALFPPIDYMALSLFHTGGVTIEAHENFQKQSYRNRYYIMGPNGRQLLQLPVRKGGKQHLPILKAEISDTLPWRSIHLRSILTAYNRSPWYLYYKEDVENLFTNSNNSLWELGMNSISKISKLLGKNVSIDLTIEYIKVPEGFIDLRAFFNPGNVDASNHNHLSPQKYYQVFSFKHGFMPNLSILDLLFNEGPESLAYLQERYSELSKEITGI